MKKNSIILKKAAKNYLTSLVRPYFQADLSECQLCLLRKEA